MAEPIIDDIEKAPTEPNLSITSNDIEIELNEKFWVELRKNIYQGTYNEDVVEHIAKVLKLVDLIYVPGVDSHQLRMKVFPLSLADDAKEWWISEGDGKITTWEELVEKFFCRFYPESYDGEDEMLDEGENWGIDPLEFLSNVNTTFKNHKKFDGRTQKVIFQLMDNGKLAHNLKFSCMIGFEFTHVNFYQLLYVNVMSKEFHNSIMKDKMVYKGDNVGGALMNVPIFVGTFSVMTDFAVLEDMDAYRDKGMGDVIVGEPFLR
ncbi:hypothetical protein Tco_1304269 [Tanacetum coccineum]